MTLRQPPCWPFNASNCPHPGGAFLPFPLHIKSGAGFPPGVVFFSAGEMPSFADKLHFVKRIKPIVYDKSLTIFLHILRFSSNPPCSPKKRPGYPHFPPSFPHFCTNFQLYKSYKAVIANSFSTLCRIKILLTDQNRSRTELERGRMRHDKGCQPSGCRGERYRQRIL